MHMLSRMDLRLGRIGNSADFQKSHHGRHGGWGPQGGPLTGDGGPARVPKLRARPADAPTWVRRLNCPQGYVVATWYVDDSPHPSLPNSKASPAAARDCARATGNAGENGQKFRSTGRQVTLDKTVGSQVW